MTLADLGADVWKVESPFGGDDTRKWCPPEVGGTSTYYSTVNRCKRSIAVDLNHPEGRRLVLELARKADVLVENFMPSSLKRWGFSYEVFKGLNPGLIYCSISGYGRSNAFADRPGYDFVMQAECGFMSITGEPGGEPMRLGVAFIDILTGMNAAQAILAALYAREQTGRGQSIDLALFDSGLQGLANVATAHLNTGDDAGRYGNAHPTLVPYQLFSTSDGEHLAVAIGNDEQYRKLCLEVLETPELWNDERFKTNTGRAQCRTMLIPLLQAQFSLRDARDLLDRMKANDIPVGEVRSVAEAMASEEARERGAVSQVRTGGAEHLRLVASPLRLSGTPNREPGVPPRLGQHTEEILRQVLGLSGEEVSALIASGAVAAG